MDSSQPPPRSRSRPGGLPPSLPLLAGFAGLAVLALAAGCASNSSECNRANTPDPVQRHFMQAREAGRKQQARQEWHQANPSGRRP